MPDDTTAGAVATFVLAALVGFAFIGWLVGKLPPAE